MALSRPYIEAHITNWEDKLSREHFSFREKWPSRIFRHDPIQTIAQILNHGTLLSRNDSEDVRVMDIAAEEVLATNTDAYDFARFYFRPRTPTQFRIEGIMKPDEPKFGRQAPMLGMMIFDARSILSNPLVRFSSCNMQSASKLVGTSEEFFSTQMEFSKIYHLGGIQGDYSIISKRCAEAMLPSPVQISDHLQHVICRSNAERETLIYMMTPLALDQWSSRILVSDDMKVFERDYTYTEDVELTSEGLLYRFNPRDDGKNIRADLLVKHLQSEKVFIQASYNDLAPTPKNALRWITREHIPPGDYLIEISLENELAYRSTKTVSSLPF